jgi:predicted nucleotide-binding protein
MNKSKKYPYTFFSVNAIREAIIELERISNVENLQPSTLDISFGSESWEHDNISEFFSDYIKNPESLSLNIHHERNGFGLRYHCYKKTTDIGVNGNNRKEIEEIFNVFDSYSTKCQVQPDEIDMRGNKPKIFIGHGGEKDWNELANHLNYKHGFQIEAYEAGARAGHTIRDILESMLENSSFALLVMTGEDLMADENIRARQNVIHEVGLFQGRLGFNRAIMLVEEGIEDFSNMDGIQQIRFSKGHIKETFGEVLATIRREFDN